MHGFQYGIYRKNVEVQMGDFGIESSRVVYSLTCESMLSVPNIGCLNHSFAVIFIFSSVLANKAGQIGSLAKGSLHSELIKFII